MSEESSAFPEYSQDDLERAFNEALTAAESLHKKFSSLAEDAGYVVNMLSFTKPELDMLYIKAQDDPTVYPIVASGIDFLKGLTSEINRISGTTDGLSTRF